MASEPATSPPARRLLPWVGRLLLIAGCLGGSVAASLYLRWGPEKWTGSHAEGHASGENHDAAEPTDQNHAGEPAAETEPAAEPTDRSIDRLIYDEQFAEALELCRGATEPWLQYRAAVCLEHLDDWTEAAERYAAVTPKASNELWANATLGIARCRLAAGELAEADAALQEVERLGGSVRPPVRRERTRLRACVEYARLGPPPAADPFAATALAWPTAVDRPTGEVIWLPPVPAAAPPDSHGDPHKEPVSVPVPAPAGEVSRGRVRESLQRVLDDDEDENATVRLTLANFDAEDGAWGKARQAYRQLIDEDPDSVEAKLASYNLGLGLLKDGQIAAARDAFLGTLDRDPHGPWADLARYWVGRTYLDAGDPTAALRPLGQACLSKTRSVQAAAELARVACHLLRQADAVMVKETRELRPEATTAAIEMHEVFDAVVRYRTTPSELRAEQVAEALGHAHDFRDLGPGGVYLAGQLYQEIGESSHMAKLYDAAAPAHRGPWAVRMTLAAAEHWDSQEKTAEARSRYLAVAAVDPDGLGRRAEQKLAEMALRNGNGRECLARCLRLWKQRPDQPEVVLRLMGRGYELTGQPAAAAACYAGREPQLD